MELPTQEMKKAALQAADDTERRSIHLTRPQFRRWKREMKAMAYLKAALAGGGKREVARRLKHVVL